MLLNVKQKIHLKDEVEEVEKIIKRKFEKYSWLKFKRVK
jgi:hypothetical protein